jgi:16S rRNA (uracil1498-N3)-methyltransferase
MTQPHPNARLFVPDLLAQRVMIALSKPQSHYLCSVMRQKDGASIALFNGKDGEWWGKLSGAGSKYVQVTCEHQARPQAAEPDVWLLFAPIKFGKIDFLVQKVTELGAAALYPVQTARTVVSRLNDDRLEANAIEAAEQSERLTIPQIHDYQPLQKMLANWPADRLLIYGDETHQGKPPAELLPPLKGQKLALLVGSEGGFSPEELAQLRKMPSAHAMSLGPRILRADTAALAALTCVMAFCGEW